MTATTHDSPRTWTIRSRRVAGRLLTPRLVAPAATFVIVIGAWQLGVFHALLNVQLYTLALPSQIGEAFAENWDSLLRQGAVTVTEAVVGYAIGSSLGFALAVACAAVRRLRGVLPMVNAINAMPIIATAPLMVLYFGNDKPSKIAVVTIMTAAPMATFAFRGLTSLDTAAVELMRSYAARERDVFRMLRLPSSLPFVFQALKLNVTLALIGAIVGEFFSSLGGLGFFMSNALVTYHIPLAWAIMTLAGLAGVTMFLAVSVVERFAIPWHSSVRGTR